jgi:5'-deoxynucleotidase YfbR-like HD superfamily hydrolase
MKILTVIAFALTLVACGSDEAPDAESEVVEERAPTVGAEIARDFNDSMDRARNVENQVMEQKDKIDAALKAAEDDT